MPVLIVNLMSRSRYGTFSELAGIDMTDHRAAAAGLPAVDSHSLVPVLMVKPLPPVHETERGSPRSVLRVRVEIMRSQTCGIVGKYQPVLILANPIIFTRTRCSRARARFWAVAHSFSCCSGSFGCVSGYRAEHTQGDSHRNGAAPDEAVRPAQPGVDDPGGDPGGRAREAMEAPDRHGGDVRVAGV
eukprot:SAG25_NODE_454_length_7870_cov_2.720499_4_plen_187_part_00